MRSKYNVNQYICLILTVFCGIVSVILIIHLVKLSRENPVVKTKVGFIKGVRAEDGDYTTFLGIPYAKVNESNPFGIATPYRRFNRVFYANNDTAICPQRERTNNTIVGSLDCLHLNIYVPNSADARTNPVPVIVYIHEEQYQLDFAGKLGPKFILSHDIILVTLNYRVGAYGFMCLDTPEIPGNQGIRDQILALKWIKKNIVAFGGDPNKITLAGAGLGGRDVQFHISGKETLFSKAIVVSGIINDALVLRPADTSIPIKLAAEFSMETSDTKEALTFLAKVPTDSVIAASTKLNLRYGPCLEKSFKNATSFVPKFSLNGDYKNMSLMIIQTNNKLSQLAYKDLDKGSEEIFKEMLVSVLDIKEDLLDSIVDEVRQFYIGDEKISNDVKQNIVDFETDLIYNYPVHQKIAHSVENGARVFYSMFSYDDGRNIVKELMNKQMADSIPSSDKLIIDRVTTMWANFAKHSNPTSEITSLLPISWEPVTNNTVPYVTVGLNLTAGVDPYRDRMQFWEKIYNQSGVETRLYGHYGL